MIGYQTVTLKATQGQRLNVIMKEMSYELDGVVVIGYGSVAKKDLTGAVGVVSGKDLKDMPVSNINNVLQGKVPGMTVSSSSGTPGAGRCCSYSWYWFYYRVYHSALYCGWTSAGWY